MIFRNQVRAREELRAISNVIKSGVNGISILLDARSGYGKTTLANLFISEFENGYGGVWRSGPPGFYLNPSSRIVFMDEVHELKRQENLYNYMDGDEHVFVFATNEVGKMNEPFINRCVPVIFSTYDNPDLLLIAHDTFKGKVPPEEVLQRFIEASNGNPRELKMLCTRLQMLTGIKGLKTAEEYFEVIERTLDIDTRGLQYLDRKYMDYLENSGGTASLTALVYGTGIDKTTIQRTIEPRLIDRRIIRVTSKGRQLV